MVKVNSYLGMAENYYLHAKVGVNHIEQIGSYNPIVAGLAQSAERFLKAILEKSFENNEELFKLMHGYNFRAIYNKIATKHKLSVSSKDCKWLGDFYFDARYPGDNFIEASAEDAEECLRLVEIIREEALTICAEIDKQRDKERVQLRQLKAFED